MKKQVFFAMAVILAAASFGAHPAFAFSTDRGGDTALSYGMPHLDDPDDQVTASLGLSGDTAEPSSYFATTGGGASTASAQASATTYRSGFSIEPDKNAGDRVRKMPQQ